MKRHEGRSRARPERPEREERPEPPVRRRDTRADPFGVRNRGSGRGSGRDDPFEDRNRQAGSRSGGSGTRTEQSDARAEGRRPSAARPAQSDSRATRSDMPTAGFEAPAARSDARTRRFDARAARFDDPRTARLDARAQQFDARTEGRDRSRDFAPQGRRPRRTEPRPRRRAQARRPARAASRSQAPPRPGPKARPRRGKGPADRLSIGAIVLSTAVGLALLGIAERALLDGGPLGGTGGPVGSQRAIRPPEPGTGTPGQPRPPAQRPAAGGGAGGAAPSGPSLRELAARVRELTLDERGAAARQAYGAAPTRQPIVGATRTSADRTWVFGTSAIPVPESSTANPEVAFYAAHWTGGRWQVGLSGGKAFTALLGDLPAAVMPASEVRLLRRYGSVGAAQAAALVNGTRAGDRLMLPWRIGHVWAMTTSDGSTSPRPLGSLAFSGGDGRVVASGDGRLYRFCGNASGNALVMLIHPSGLATTYYGLRNTTSLRDGSAVEQGDALGGTGTGRPCGGAEAPRAEVGFALRGGGGAVPLDGAEIGGWTFRERAKPLLGFAERGALQVLPGGLMANLGPVPAADEPPPASPSPGSSPADGAGTAGAPAAAATEKRSPNGANSQQ
ncbi:M23 family metallopeptidase [Actinomadura chokoriensis]|uniref:M23 family metallopeptidase n=1 Tax=Actinomadura chokoriensis TaxID=454156 RepID=A0ABV4QV88_9ACTN